MRRGRSNLRRLNWNRRKSKMKLSGRYLRMYARRGGRSQGTSRRFDCTFGKYTNRNFALLVEEKRARRRRRRTSHSCLMMTLRSPHPWAHPLLQDGGVGELLMARARRSLSSRCGNLVDSHTLMLMPLSETAAGRNRRHRCGLERLVQRGKETCDYIWFNRNCLHRQ